jgi:hypothetical protein
MTHHSEDTIIKQNTWYQGLWVKYSMLWHPGIPLKENLKIVDDEGNEYGEVFVKKNGTGSGGEGPPKFP